MDCFHSKVRGDVAELLRTCDWVANQHRNREARLRVELATAEAREELLRTELSEARTVNKEPLRSAE